MILDLSLLASAPWGLALLLLLLVLALKVLVLAKQRNVVSGDDERLVLQDEIGPSWSRRLRKLLVDAMRRRRRRR